MLRSKWFQTLTPELAWEQYVDMPIERFVSEFHSEGITDVREMCQRFTQDIPGFTNQLFTQKQLDHIAELLKTYINSIGYDQLKIYTEEELNEIWNEERDDLIKIIEQYLLS